MYKSLLMAYGFEESSFPDLVEKCRELECVGIFEQDISTEYGKDHYRVIGYRGHEPEKPCTWTHDRLAVELREGLTFALYRKKGNTVHYEVYRINKKNNK